MLQHACEIVILAHTPEGSGWGGPIEPWELHPALTHFPIAFLLCGVLLDLCAWWRKRPDLARISTWLLVVGVVTGVLTALAGLLAFFTVPAHTDQAHRLMYWHLIIQTVALILFAWPTAKRWRNAALIPTIAMRLVACMAAIMLAVGSGIGGYIVYHGGAGIEPTLLAAVVRQGHEHGSGGDGMEDMKGMKHESMKGMEDMKEDATKDIKSSSEKSSDYSKGRQHVSMEHESGQSESENESPAHSSASSKGVQHETMQHEPGQRASQSPARRHEMQAKRAPEELPSIPLPDAQAAEVPAGYRVEVAMAGLEYPTSIGFDDKGTTYVAEGGYIYGDDVAPALVLRIDANGERTVLTDRLNGPVTDLLWHDGRLYISHRGKISVMEAGAVRDLVTGLPSLGDHHNNQLVAGPDGKIYFGQGTATNSGVVGLDNFKMGWLAKYPEVHDVTAKDIRVNRQAFETPDPLSMLAERRQSQSDSSDRDKKQSGDKEPTDGQDSSHQGHDGGDASKRNSERDSEGNGQHEGHAMPSKPATGGEGHGGHDGSSDQEQEPQTSRTVQSFPFRAFGTTPPDEGAIRGEIKANGTILRMNPDGSDLEMFAWGLRNPFGLVWSVDGKLYASDNGYDERGSRPIAHAPDYLSEVKRDAWYGFPDYSGDTPVTDAQFRPENGPAPKFLMRDHPPIEKPLMKLPTHAGAAKMDYSRNAKFGFQGQLFVALSGDMNPITGEHAERSGFEVVRVDPAKAKFETFFRTQKSSLGPKGMEYVVTAGPKRPVDVCFSRDGSALYVVDVGAMAIVSTATGPAPRPFPGTGVVWRIVRQDNTTNETR